MFSFALIINRALNNRDRFKNEPKYFAHASMCAIGGGHSTVNRAAHFSFAYERIFSFAQKHDISERSSDGFLLQYY